RRPPSSTLFPYTTLFRSTVSSVFKANNDTIVSTNSQSDGATDTATLSGLVHTQLAPTDTGETASSEVWRQILHWLMGGAGLAPLDRKSTRLNSSHVAISY